MAALCLIRMAKSRSGLTTTAGNRVMQFILWISEGKVLFTIIRKKFKWLGCREGYRSTSAADFNRKKPGFRVRKLFRIPRGASSSPCEATVGLDKDQYYKMQTWTTKGSSWKIVDSLGGLVAEVKRKISRRGVVLGEDVLTMVVEPNIDHSLVMGLIVVYSLIHHKM